MIGDMVITLYLCRATKLLLECSVRLLEFEAWLRSLDALSGIVSSSASLFSRRYLEKCFWFILFLQN